jgi:L-threonylcarbamoyladenylate synthase
MMVISMCETPIDRSAISRAGAVLRRGGVVAYPTDTFYGLAADPRHDAAVSRIYEIKGRPPAAAMPLIAASREQAGQAAGFAGVADRLATKFWPGPLTVVLPALPGLAAPVLGGGTTVAIRVPAHEIARALARELGFPITATSANRTGQPPAVTAADLGSAGLDDVDLLLDAGPCRGGLPSTMIEAQGEGVRLVRAGAVPWERVLESLE